jgi:hypothetical protein
VEADQNIKEQDALAGKKAAEIEEQASLDISKIKARAAGISHITYVAPPVYNRWHVIYYICICNMVGCMRRPQ